ncbi:MAG: hypothetical protein IKH47_02570, partial [Bacteroidaceae bacterium]|nr:hypothetical protein [Bacteroidaceae bacterium]
MIDRLASWTSLRVDAIVNADNRLPVRFHDAKLSKKKRTPHILTLKKYTLAIIFCKKNMAAAQKSTAATMVITYSFLQLRTGSDEGLTGLVAF